MSWLDDLQRIAEEMKATNLFLLQDWIDTIFDRLVQVKRLLEENERMTHLEILRKVLPAVGFAYDEVLRHDEHPSDRFYRLHSFHYSIKDRTSSKSNVQTDKKLKSAWIEYRSQSELNNSLFSYL